MFLFSFLCAVCWNYPLKALNAYSSKTAVLHSRLRVLTELLVLDRGLFRAKHQKTETQNSGKPVDMVEKIAKGKILKFLNDNSLLNQLWIMDPKKKVSEVLKENSSDKEIKVLDFIRYKVGEGVD